MRQRELLPLLWALTGLPFAAAIQAAAMPVIEFLHPGSPEQHAERLAAFHKGSSAEGFVEGRNVAIEYRWALADKSKLLLRADELIE
jgi:putative ABC transport system substrate-binding protein